MLKLKFKLLCQIISLQFQIWQLDIDIWRQKRSWKNNEGTYTQVCLNCYKPNQYEFYGVLPDKHVCFNCGEIF
jgi:hypothetical protein